MRSSALALRFGFFAFFAGALVAGCSTESSTAALDTQSRNNEEPTYAGTPNEKLTGEDAAPKPLPTYRGNPLCRVDASTCMPDDDGTKVTAGTVQCEKRATFDMDSGTTNSAMQACRIGKTGTASVAPSCQVKTGEGGDGAACETGEDCAAGFDCVAGEKTKTCRHYCCLGGCKAQTSQSGGPTFCDVQRLADVDHNAPVCMPLKRCKLLQPGECSANETCGIVTESGDTSCVTIGDKQVNESCDEEHCAAGLTCLGQPGARKCQALCKVGSSTACGPTKTCTTSAIFKDSTIGVCQAP